MRLGKAGVAVALVASLEIMKAAVADFFKRLHDLPLNGLSAMLLGEYLQFALLSEASAPLNQALAGL